MLDHAFEKLKEECGKDPSFFFPEMEVIELFSLELNLKLVIPYGCNLDSSRSEEFDRAA